MSPLDERRLRRRFAALADRTRTEDWDDVLVRAGLPRRRRRPLVVAAAVAALVAVPALALAGRMVGFFSQEGTPIPRGTLVEPDRRMLLRLCARVRLVERPGRAPELRCVGGMPRLEEVGNDGRRRFVTVRYPDGTLCLLSGDVAKRRADRERYGTLGSGGCSRGGDLEALFPSPRRPLTVDVAGGTDAGDERSYLLWVAGLAGDGVASVRLVDDDDGAMVERRVRGRAYSFLEIPRRDWDAVVAIGEDGDELFRHPLDLEGSTARLRPHAAPPQPPRVQAPPPPPRPAGTPLQRGQGDAAVAHVYRPGIVRLLLSPGSPGYGLLERSGKRTQEYRFSGRVSVTVGCQQAAYGAGRWETLGAGSSAQLAPELQIDIRPSGGFASAEPPFDFCSVAGHYGRSFDDGRSRHDAIEVPFTETGRRFLDERAAARDLSYFVRSPRLRAVRRSLKRGGDAPSAAAIVEGYPARVVAVRRRTAALRPGRIAVWSDGRATIEISTRSTTGRRLWVRLVDGRIHSHNLHALAGVF